MNPELKNEQKQAGDGKEISKTLAMSQTDSTTGINGDDRGMADAGERTPGKTGTEPVRPETEDAGGTETGGSTRGKRNLMIALGGAACAVLVMGALFFAGRGGSDTEDPDLILGGETQSTDSPGTMPMQTEPEQEDTRYQQTLEECAALEEEGRYEDALLYLAGCMPPEGDSRLEELVIYYQELYTQDILARAETLAAAGQFPTAIRTIRDAREICDSAALRGAEGEYRQAFGLYNTSVLAAGKYNTVLIRNGRVSVVGESEQGELKAGTWGDVVAVSAGDRHVLGLKSDGTVVAAGNNSEHQMDVTNWWNVIAISAGDTHSVGLCADGTVVAAGYNHMGQCDVVNLMRAAGDKRIVSVSAGYGHTLALLENGTVVSTGVNEFGECSVSGWTDIAAIYTGSEFSAGLRTDGTVVVAGLNTQLWDVYGWTDIVNLAAGDYYLIGLKADGTVLAVGTDDSNYSEEGQMNVGHWQNIVMIAAGNDHTVAVRDDGTVLCVGSNEYGQCDCYGMTVN